MTIADTTLHTTTPSHGRSDYLDMRPAVYHLNTSGIYAGATKAVAVTFAKKWGWSAARVHKAASRLSTFWVVGQCIGDDYTFLLRNGSTTTLPFPGYC